MFNRLTDGLILSVIRSTDGPLMMLRGCSFTRETDGPLRVINGRLIDWTYCTQAPPASSDGNEARRFYPDRGAD